MRGQEHYRGASHLCLRVWGWTLKELSPQLPVLSCLCEVTDFAEEMDEFSETPVARRILPLHFSTLHCRAAVCDERLWQMSPDGTLTLILPHSLGVYFGFMSKQMFSVEKTWSVAECIVPVCVRGSWCRRPTASGLVSELVWPAGGRQGLSPCTGPR